MDGRLSELSLMTAAGSMNVSVLTPAEANNPDYPVLPRTTPTLLISGLIGLRRADCSRSRANFAAPTVGVTRYPLAERCRWSRRRVRPWASRSSHGFLRRTRQRGFPLERLAQEVGEFANAVRNSPQCL